MLYINVLSYLRLLSPVYFATAGVCSETMSFSVIYMNALNFIVIFKKIINSKSDLAYQMQNAVLQTV